MPATVVVQLAEPLTNDSDVCLMGATPAMSGVETSDERPIASSNVSVDDEPNPPRTPLEVVALPGDTISRSLPSALICALTLSCAPLPNADFRGEGSF